MTDSSPNKRTKPEKIKLKGLDNDSGWTVLRAAATASAIIALATLVVEFATDEWLARTLGLGVFVSTPLGVGGVFLTGLTARENKEKALIPATLVAAYWLLYILGMQP